MVDQEGKSATAAESMDNSYLAQWVVVGLVVLCGVIFAIIEFSLLGISCEPFSQCLFFTALYIGPYVLLGACVPFAWDSKIAQMVSGLVALYALYLSVSLVLIGKPRSAPGSISAVVPLLVPVYQCEIGAVALVVCIIVWSVNNWWHRNDCRRVRLTPSFDDKLVIEMERAMASKETAELKLIFSLAQARPDQYAEELVQAVRQLLVSRGETPSP